MTVRAADLRKAAEGIRGDLIDFCQRLIRVPSETGNEGAVAEVFRTELERLGFDSVTHDAFGNVCGRIPGVSEGDNLLLAGHLDQVRVEAHFPGHEGEWPFEPFAAEISSGYIWGRGASDVKGALAAQVHAASLLKSLAPDLSGDVIIGGVVHDEQSFPLGIRYLCEETLPRLGWTVDVAVTGPATSLDISLGHMGKVELEVTVEGVSRHLREVEDSINPIYESRTLVDVLQRIIETLPTSPVLGKERMAPTRVTTTSPQSSITPSEYTASINWRFLPGRTKEDVAAELEQACRDAVKANPNFKFRIEGKPLTVTSYTGLEQTVGASCGAFLMSEDDPFVRRVKAALEAVGQRPGFTSWTVPTHTGYLGGTLGLPTVGYSPCEYEFNHTTEDRVRVDALFESMIGYAAIALGL